MRAKTKRPLKRRERVDVSKLAPIKGIGYYFDAETRRVANKRGLVLSSHCGGFSSRNRSKYYIIYVDGQRHSISENRLFFAALHGLNPLRIPDTLVVVNTNDGGLRLTTKSERGRETAEFGYRLRKEGINERSEYKMRELQILQHYYNTGDTAELLSYTISRTDQLARYVRHKFSWSADRCTDIAMEAVDWFCQRVERGDLAVTSISGIIKQHARALVKQQQRRRTWSDTMCCAP